MSLVHHALPLLLINSKNQVDEIEGEKLYQRFKKLILLKYLKLLSQNVDVFLFKFENKLYKELEFLSNILREQGFNYSIRNAIRLCHDHERARDPQRFEQSLQKKRSMNFSDIDTMTGYEFEDFLINLFTNRGYHVEQRKPNHEQGLDFLLERHGERIAYQVKRYNRPVENKTMQKVITARDYYRGQKALIVTNSRFTTSTKQPVERSGVELRDRKNQQNTSTKQYIHRNTILCILP